MQYAERVKDGRMILVMGQLFKFLDKEMDLIKDLRLVHVKNGVDQVCVFT